MTGPRDVVRVTPADMRVHVVAMNVDHAGADALVRMGRQTEHGDLYGHVPAGTVRHGERWRRGLRRLGVTARERML